MTQEILLPHGFRYAGLAAGIKSSGAKDLMLIAGMPNRPLIASGVYTQNLVRAASIDWNRELTPGDSIGGLIVNSGNANACTGQQGAADNQQMAETVAKQLGFSAQQVLTLSTGVIGEHLPMKNIRTHIPTLCGELGSDGACFQNAAEAILTTDNGTKTAFHSIAMPAATNDPRSLGIIAGMCKGAGMIGPRMATMLGILTTDFSLTPELAQRCLQSAVDRSFNCISVDGHMSTNDAVILLSSAEPGEPSAEALGAFEASLAEVCIELAKQIPADGEGSDHLVEVTICGTALDSEADKIARSIAASNLVKTAICGCDPNWGRIVSAAGYAGVEFDPQQLALKLNGAVVFEGGSPVPFDELRISESMKEDRFVKIELTVGKGPGVSTHWTSDLTYEYVRINAEYRT